MLVESKKLADSNEDAGGFDEEMDGDAENIDVVNNNDDVVFGDRKGIHNESDLRQDENEKKTKNQKVDPVVRDVFLGFCSCGKERVEFKKSSVVTPGPQGSLMNGLSSALSGTMLGTGSLPNGNDYI